MKNLVKMTNAPIDAQCDCGYGLHEHSECKSGARCTNCNITFLYSTTKLVFVRDGIVDPTPEPTFICPYCEGDLCKYCGILLDATFEKIIEEMRVAFDTTLCRRCKTEPADGFFEDGIWYIADNNDEEDRYCSNCAEWMMAANETQDYEE